MSLDFTKIAYTIFVCTALDDLFWEHSAGARYSLQVGGSGFDPRRLHQTEIELEIGRVLFPPDVP